MLGNGLYELFYRYEAVPGSGYESFLIALRDGRLLGSDRWGGVIVGSFDFDVAARRHFKIPPGGMLVSDAAPRDDGDIVEIEAALLGSGRDASGVVLVSGQPVRIELLFIGSVPY
jgi:hypothetical protein